MGFSTATEIQAKTIPLLLENHDLIGQAGTGTGKTAAFAIPTIEKLDAESKDLQALILCPTRELAVQVAEQFSLLMKYQSKLSSLAIYGGQSIYTQLKALQRGPQVVIGTPGRVMDHMRRGTIKLRKLKFLILDEADRMLDMGFQDAIETILEDTPAERQTIMFSATMQPEILKLTKRYQQSPKHIDVTAGKASSPQIDQVYYSLKNKSKLEALKRLIAFHKIGSALIFCNTKRRVDDLCDDLRDDGFAAAGLHGDLRQNKRDSVMKGFRQDEVRLLVATDVAARGIDVDNVDAVFNYDLPRDDEDYVHRIGRTGRAGKTGLAITFTVGSERNHIERIARRNSGNIDAGKIPSLKDLELDTLEAWLQLINETTLTNSNRKKYLKAIRDFETEGLSREDIPAALRKFILEEKCHILGEEIDFNPDIDSAAPSNKRRSGGSRQGFGGGNKSFGGGSRGDFGGEKKSFGGGGGKSRGGFGGGAKSSGGKSFGGGKSKFTAARKPSSNQQRRTSGK